MATPPDLLLDTSALLERWLDGPGSPAMLELLARPELRGHLFCAAHLEGEFLATVNRHFRRHQLDAPGLRAVITGFYQQFPDLFGIVPITADVLWRGHLILHTHPLADVEACGVYHLAALGYAAAALDANPFLFVSSEPPRLQLARSLGFLTFDPRSDAPADLLA